MPLEQAHARAGTANHVIQVAQTAQPENTEAISSATINRALEKIAAILPATVAGGPTHGEGDAFAQARARHNEPVVARALAELMMTSPDQEVRSLAELALTGTANAEAKTLLQAEHMIRKLGEGGGKFGSGPENADELMAALTKMREHPLVGARLVESVTSGGSAAYYAATVLQGTSDQATLEALKSTLTKALDGGFQAGWELRDLWQVPHALKGSTDPGAQALIIRAFKEGREAFNTNNLRHVAACALGAMNTAEVRELAIESVMAPRQDWHVRKGVAEAIRELNTAEVDNKLRPLIEGSATKTAWIIASEQSGSFAGRISTWIGLMTSDQTQIHDIRVQVGLALRERHPDLAAKVFDDALKGKRDVFKYRCDFFAAGDALRALQKMESAS